MSLAALPPSFVPPIQTKLYPMEPIGVGTGQCESISSYGRRLAVAHGVTIAELCRYIAISTNLEGAGLRTASTVKHFDRENTSLLPGLIMATGQPMLVNCTVGPLVNIFSGLVGSDGQRIQRFCPVCIDENRYPGAWGRILWRMPLVLACPVHKVKLAVAKCGSRRRRFGAPSFPGVCSRCGAIGYQCATKENVDASSEDLWTAFHLSRVVAAASSGQSFDIADAKRAFRSLTELHYGNVFAAARSIGLKKFSVGVDFYESKRLPMEILIHFCKSTGTDLLGLLQGASKPAEKIFNGRSAITRVRHSPDDLALQFLQATRADPKAPITTIARSLRTTPARLASICPHWVSNHLKARQNILCRERTERRGRTVQELKSLKVELDGAGEKLNANVAGKRLGMVFLTGSENYRILKLVQRGKL